LTYRERREARAEKRREARAKRLRGRADKHEKKSEKAGRAAQKVADRTRFGFPELPGEYASISAWRDRDYIWKKNAKSFKHLRIADELRERADNIERAAKQANRPPEVAKAYPRDRP